MSIVAVTVLLMAWTNDRHGLFWGQPLAIVGPHRRRVAYLLERGIGLYACHIPLGDGLLLLLEGGFAFLELPVPLVHRLQLAVVELFTLRQRLLAGGAFRFAAFDARLILAQRRPVGLELLPFLGEGTPSRVGSAVGLILLAAGFTGIATSATSPRSEVPVTHTLVRN